MWIRIFNAFTKITGFPVQFFCFRTRVLYEDRAVQGRRIRGRAILISNHTSVFDYAVFLFVFFFRTLRYQMAEVLYTRRFLAPFLRQMGGIYVDRNSPGTECIRKSEEILGRGGVVGIFPEGRIPGKEEETPLPFKSGAAYLALSTGAPIIPVVTNGSYFCRRRAVVLIGKPIDARSLADPALSHKENLDRVTAALREKIAELKEQLYARTETPKTEEK